MSSSSSSSRSTNATGPTGSGSTPATSTSASASASANTNAQQPPRTCFICLQTEAEDPAAVWVNACPCSLEAHESCMLAWITEQESRGGGAGGRAPTLQCSACKAPIRVDEPYDPVVALRDRLHRSYSRVSPFVFLCILTCGGVAGSGWYGLTAAQVFAGPAPTFQWLGIHQLLFARRSVPLWRWAPLWELNLKIWMLSLIGPGLILSRALPGQMRTLCIPVSLMYGAALVGRDDMPSWPPSPEWAWTLMPYVHLTYSHLYWEFFGPLEKRLNRALRGQPPIEAQPPATPRQQQQDQAANAIAVQDVQDAQDVQRRQGRQGRQEGGPGAEDHGLLQGIWGLWRALFHDDEHAIVEGELALEVRIGVADEEDEEEEDRMEDDEIVEVVEVVRELAEDAARREGPQQQQQQVEGDRHAAAAELAAAIADQQQQQQRQQQNQDQDQNQNQNRNQNQANDETNRMGGALMEIINSVVTSLLLPVISFGAGEALRLTLPRGWVAPPSGRRPPTALLQQRWGRSLLGGCLFLVLRDAYVLYTKYRRVQVKRHRKVRNVEKRARAADADADAGRR